MGHNKKYVLNFSEKAVLSPENHIQIMEILRSKSNVQHN